MGGKATDRAAKKQAMKQQQDDEPAEASAPGREAMIASVKQVVMGSVIVTLAPKVPNLVLEGIDFHKAAKTGSTSGHAKKNQPAVNGDKKPDEKEENEVKEKDEQKEEASLEDKNDEVVGEPQTNDSIFDGLASRLQLHNALGLGLPTSGEDAKDAWLNFRNLEFDGGPRSRKKGNPAMDRILANMQNNIAQYWHVLLALMVLRAFLFRSFFACLPWLCVYQVLSLMIPRGFLEDKMKVIHLHVGLRIVACIFIHALLWFFFVFEALYKTYFLEKVLYIGVIVCHAYVVRPAQVSAIN